MLLPSQGLGFLFLEPHIAALPGEVDQEELHTWSRQLLPQPVSPGHCGNSGTTWASGAVLWRRRRLFLWELMRE